ncbi:UDP-N-acetylmuramoylalanyl-D-glutamate--2,6-diaminopimelate ligase [Palleronia marisminoris]|uniref:UDP-N-acetylmuramoyl-L-alanyl-D-glutamate--2,6-diaminopimelate ligase n=1 Tax=Palleronia marisminoris TaxID=315423 RepID=A0A1Y5RR52_9RHOB|nr:UDP-N-acetylmuramoyl-L-alanyl-D-glutamate--2,6-diaminopimelate ligase [Palleronia marisminoris]SFG53742.1 UDP-N-acetylmuramoylalanyl-D-glutamate--2,6-diaminopimelate ligase [Palleronia marisminoris]SLN23403.1 UDP-N-acetylmuramoyl-L-alanyl-D-glutamate--2, 6-diaminopimelate ligase [Palleronia marisminoris]
MAHRTRTLADLGLSAQGGRDARITGISVDSRETREGHLFAALPGTCSHGATFVETAIGMGATAILTDREGLAIARPALDGTDVAVVVAETPRQALAYAAALWFGTQPETMVAVTGTNGKTSVASFTRQIWTALGHRAVNIGTTGVEGSWETPLRHTTPEPVTLHRVLCEAAAEGITHAAMEASSHGLDQYRLDGVTLRAAGFTNFTQDHLDYHADFEEYFAAKAGLFDRVLPEDGTAVINVEDEKGDAVRAIAEARGQDSLTVGRRPDAALRIIAQRFDPTGQHLRFAWNAEPRQVRLGLIGGFQAENVLLAAGLAIASGSEPRDVFEVLPQLSTVRGRMQLAATRGSGAAVFVDYAHTPAALETALKALRPHTMGRLVVVYGAGGDRDRGKRPLMGTAARDHADVRIVTDDNPRSEEPASIRAEILAADPEAIEIGDRAEAILRAVDMLEDGDALLIAGKGHETGQIVGDTVYPFDDAEQASVAVAALDGRFA